MKTIIRTYENGEELSREEIQGKIRRIKESLVSQGLEYLETDARLGSYDAAGRPVEERVIVIDDLGVSLIV